MQLLEQTSFANRARSTLDWISFKGFDNRFGLGILVVVFLILSVLRQPHHPVQSAEKTGGKAEECVADVNEHFARAARESPSYLAYLKSLDAAYEVGTEGSAGHRTPEFWLSQRQSTPAVNDSVE